MTIPPPLKNNGRGRGAPTKYDAEINQIVDATKDGGGFHMEGPLSERERGRWRKNIAHAGKKLNIVFKIETTQADGLWITRKVAAVA